MTINICRKFSETLGARYKTEGKFSGEEFRESLLNDRYLEARKLGEKLTIELDGGYGYPTSFLEEAFGGLARDHDPHEVNETLEFVSEDEPSLVAEIRGYILNANEKKR